MALESATYIDGLNASNPTGTDPKSQGDDHIRLLKSTVKATFPNISGAVTPTHTELNYVDGVTSAIQTQIDAKGAHAGQVWTGAHDFTDATPTVPTQPPADNSTKAASTAYVDAADDLKADLDSPALTGTPTAPTATTGTNTTQIATTAFVQQAAFEAALPNQSGNSGKFLTTDGSDASWTNILDLKAAKSSNYTVIATDRYAHFVLTSSGTLSITAAATLGDGFRFWVRNDGTSVWTIDPNSSETIDGRATIKVYPGEAFAVIGDGSSWRTFGRARRALVSSTDVTGVSTVEFSSPFLDAEVKTIEFELDDVVSASATHIAHVKASGSYITTGTYNYATWNETGNLGSGNNQAFIYASGGSQTRVSSRISVFAPFSTAAAGPGFRTTQINRSFEAIGSQTGAITIEAVRFSLSTAGAYTSGFIRCYINR